MNIKNKRALLFFIFFICLLIPHYGRCNDVINVADAAYRIKELRKKQLSASFGNYWRYEDEIRKIKKQFEQKNQQHYVEQDYLVQSSWENSKIAQKVYSILHLIPFIMWQLMFLLLLISLLFYNLTFFKISIFVILMYCLIALYCEKSIKWHIVVDKNVKLYLGPSKKYPVKMMLNLLDELIIKKRVPVENEKKNHSFWLQVERSSRLGGSGDLGWIRQI